MDIGAPARTRMRRTFICFFTKTPSAAGTPTLAVRLTRSNVQTGFVSRRKIPATSPAPPAHTATSSLRSATSSTLGHSWVMAFPSEREAFETWAEVMPNNAVLLVDTYNTLDGVRHAIEVGRKMRANGHELQGIRLDSGDLAYLSIQARQMLDEAGFTGTSIAASNELDEHL